MATGFQHNIPVVKQPSDQECWKYCAEVLYLFKNGRDQAQAFRQKLGKYAGIHVTLTRAQLEECYAQLGFQMGDVRVISERILRQQPLILAYDRADGSGHLVLLIGIDNKGQLVLSNGCIALKKKQCQAGDEHVTVQDLNQAVENTYWY